jgi:hypothetical protein
MKLCIDPESMSTFNRTPPTDMEPASCDLPWVGYRRIVAFLLVQRLDDEEALAFFLVAPKIEAFDPAICNLRRANFLEAADFTAADDPTVLGALDQARDAELWCQLLLVGTCSDLAASFSVTGRWRATFVRSGSPRPVVKSWISEGVIPTGERHELAAKLVHRASATEESQLVEWSIHHTWSEPRSDEAREFRPEWATAVQLQPQMCIVQEVEARMCMTLSCGRESGEHGSSVAVLWEI